MNILAIELSSSQRSVAVRLRSGPVVEVVRAGADPADTLAMVGAALTEAKLEREQVDCLAIGLGPGSYTGIRSAIAVAQGWRLSREVRLVGISSAECLARQAQGEGVDGRVHIVIDAQRGEFYLATYEIGRGACREVEPLRLATLEDVRQRQATGGILTGPDATRWFPNARAAYPSAAGIAELASGRSDSVDGAEMEPIYLRETQFVKAPRPRIVP
jgi:tRNA threonylcarbamoyl adenosine modification protein YeaZ